MDNQPKRQTSEQALAMAFVIIINWLISHLATSWQLPPEVQSAVQSCFVIVIGWYASLVEKREMAKQLTMARSLGWSPPQTTAPSNDPAPAAPENKAA